VDEIRCNWGLNTDFGNSIGYGGRVGAFIAPNWNLEADGQYIPAQAATGSDFKFIGVPGGDVKGSNLSARLVYSFRLARSVHPCRRRWSSSELPCDENVGGATISFGATDWLDSTSVSAAFRSASTVYSTTSAPTSQSLTSAPMLDSSSRRICATFSAGERPPIRSCGPYVCGPGWTLRSQVPLNLAVSYSGRSSMTTLESTT